MSYFIPQGTPVEIRQGESLRPHTTDQDLFFADLAADTPDELVFDNAGVLMLVAKAFVVVASRSEVVGGKR